MNLPQKLAIIGLFLITTSFTFAEFEMHISNNTDFYVWIQYTPKDQDKQPSKSLEVKKILLKPHDPGSTILFESRIFILPNFLINATNDISKAQKVISIADQEGTIEDIQNKEGSNCVVTYRITPESVMFEQKCQKKT